MEDLVNITISIQPHILYKCVSMLIDHQNDLDYHCIKDDDKLRELLIQLLLQSKDVFDQSLQKQFISCLSNNHIQVHFLKLLDLMQTDYPSQYDFVLNCLSTKVNSSQYASISEDVDFHQQLIQLLIHQNDDYINTAMKNYKTVCQDNVKENVKDQIDEQKIKMLNLLDDDTFDKILSTLGLDEQGLIKAKKIKQDVKDNKFDINEILSFVQDYKQLISQSDNPLIGNILNIFGIQKEPVKQDEVVDTNIKIEPPQAPQFDMSQIMNMVSPLLSGLQQNRQQKRQVKHYSKRR